MILFCRRKGILKVKALITLAGVSNFVTRFPKNDRLEQYREKGVFYVINGRTKQEMPHYWQFYENFKKHESELDIQKAAQNLQKALSDCTWDRR